MFLDYIRGISLKVHGNTTFIACLKLTIAGEIPFGAKEGLHSKVNFDFRSRIYPRIE